MELMNGFHTTLALTNLLWMPNKTYNVFINIQTYLARKAKAKN